MRRSSQPKACTPHTVLFSAPLQSSHDKEKPPHIVSKSPDCDHYSINAFQIHRGGSTATQWPRIEVNSKGKRSCSFALSIIPSLKHNNRTLPLPISPQLHHPRPQRLLTRNRMLHLPSRLTDRNLPRHRDLDNVLFQLLRTLDPRVRLLWTLLFLGA